LYADPAVASTAHPGTTKRLERVAEPALKSVLALDECHDILSEENAESGCRFVVQHHFFWQLPGMGSRERVKAFSSQGAVPRSPHSSCDTIVGGALIAICP